MLVLRLSRIGRSKKYAYRIVLQDKRTAVKRKAIEILGHYQPAMKDKPLVLDKDRITYLISKGAIPSDSVAVLLKKQGFSDMDKFMELRNKKRAKKGEEEAAKSAPEAPQAGDKKPEEATKPA